VAGWYCLVVCCWLAACLIGTELGGLQFATRTQELNLGGRNPTASIASNCYAVGRNDIRCCASNRSILDCEGQLC
jgi:hypothetical protein